ncbi:MAG: hypothetical protein ACLGI3_10915 [Actinomycetes bacterium]
MPRVSRPTAIAPQKKLIQRPATASDCPNRSHLASFFDVLFALNRVPLPGEKRLLAIAAPECRLLPPDLPALVNGAASATAPPWDGGRLVAALHALVDALDDHLATKTAATLDITWATRVPGTHGAVSSAGKMCGVVGRDGRPCGAGAPGVSVTGTIGVMAAVLVGVLGGVVGGRLERQRER